MALEANGVEMREPRNDRLFIEEKPLEIEAIYCL